MPKRPSTRAAGRCGAVGCGRGDTFACRLRPLRGERRWVWAQLAQSRGAEAVCPSVMRGIDAYTGGGLGGRRRIAALAPSRGSGSGASVEPSRFYHKAMPGSSEAPDSQHEGACTNEASRMNDDRRTEMGGEGAPRSRPQTATAKPLAPAAPGCPPSASHRRRPPLEAERCLRAVRCCRRTLGTCPTSLSLSPSQQVAAITAHDTSITYFRCPQVMRSPEEIKTTRPSRSKLMSRSHGASNRA